MKDIDPTNTTPTAHSDPDAIPADLLEISAMLDRLADADHGEPDAGFESRLTAAAMNTVPIDRAAAPEESATPSRLLFGRGPALALAASVLLALTAGVFWQVLGTSPGTTPTDPTADPTIVATANDVEESVELFLTLAEGGDLLAFDDDFATAFDTLSADLDSLGSTWPEDETDAWWLDSEDSI